MNTSMNSAHSYTEGSDNPSFWSRVKTALKMFSSACILAVGFWTLVWSIGPALRFIVELKNCLIG